MKVFFKILMFFLLANVFGVSLSAAVNEPVVLLIQAKGKVTYSIDGKIWTDVNRNKFLYNGYYLKTGSTGSCKLISQETDMIYPINNDTEIIIEADEISVIKGLVSEPESGGGLISFIKRKFAKVQKYAVAKRHGRPDSKMELKTIRNITLSKTYPDLVWENKGPEYSYQFVIDEKDFEIPGGRGDIIRFTLPQMMPGQFEYYVSILYNGEILYTPERKGRIIWLSDSEDASFEEKKSRVLKIAPDNGFLLGNIMDEHGLKVAAMDQFQNFLSENPDINEARPFLIKIYNDLKLNKLKQTETENYHKNFFMGN